MEKEELASLMHEVNELIAEVEKTHRYSASKIYGLSNKVFNKNETPEGCASCLIRKVNDLKLWYKEAKIKYAEIPATETVKEKTATKGKKKKEG